MRKSATVYLIAMTAGLVWCGATSAATFALSFSGHLEGTFEQNAIGGGVLGDVFATGDLFQGTIVYRTSSSTCAGCSNETYENAISALSVTVGTVQYSFVLPLLEPVPHESQIVVRDNDPGDGYFFSVFGNEGGTPITTTHPIASLVPDSATLSLDTGYRFAVNGLDLPTTSLDPADFPSGLISGVFGEGAYFSLFFNDPSNDPLTPRFHSGRIRGRLDSLELQPVPVPASVWLLAAALGFFARRRSADYQYSESAQKP